MRQNWITNYDRFWITNCDKNFENWITKCNGITKCDKSGLQISKELESDTVHRPELFRKKWCT